MEQQSIEMLEALFRDVSGDQYIEYRSATPGRSGMHQSYVDLAKWRRGYFGPTEPGKNRYYGVCPRKDKGGTTASVTLAVAVWFDECPKGLDGLPELSWLLETSPGKRQGGYFLDKPTMDLARIQKLNIRLRDAVGGDNVQDVARVLRLPGYANMKPEHILESGEHPIAELRILEPDRRYSLDELDTLLPAAPLAPSAPVQAGIDSGRNVHLTKIAGSLARNMPAQDVKSLIIDANARLPVPLPQAELEATIFQSVGRWELGAISEMTTSTGQQVQHAPGGMNDTANGLRFVEQFGSKVRYAPEYKSWLIWDGCRWCRDAGGAVRELAKKTAYSIEVEAAGVIDPDFSKALMRWAKYSRSVDGINKILIAARTDARITVSLDQLDQKDWLFNCPNGTLDLRTGKLRAADPDDLITHCGGAEYHPDAVDDVWNQFLTNKFPEQDSLRWLQKYLGAMLGVSTSSDVIAYLFGASGAGKTTLLVPIVEAMGDYAGILAPSSIMIQAKGSRRFDLGQLPGKRFIYVPEITERDHLDLHLLKCLTGGEPIPAELKGIANFSFKSQAHLVLAGNDRARAMDTDAAFWARMRQFPMASGDSQWRLNKGTAVDWEYTLRTNPGAQQAILAWLVVGHQMGQQEGLGTCAEVTKCTEAYRWEQNPLAAFIEDVCAYPSDGHVAQAELWQMFELWRRNSNVRASIRKHDFTKRVADLQGVDLIKSSGVLSWHGISLDADSARALKVY